MRSFWKKKYIESGILAYITTDKEALEEKMDALELAKSALDASAVGEQKRDAALEKLSQDQIIVTYENKKGNLHANTRDINVSGVTVTFHGKPLVEDTEIIISYGNRCVIVKMF